MAEACENFSPLYSSLKSACASKCSNTSSSYFSANGLIAPGVIECSPPKINGNFLLIIIYLFRLDNCVIASLILFFILKGLRVLMPILL